MICSGQWSQWKRHQWSEPDEKGLVECKRCPRIKNNPQARALLAKWREQERTSTPTVEESAVQKLDRAVAVLNEKVEKDLEE